MADEILIVGFLLFGLIVGSFLNVVIVRMPEAENRYRVLNGRSKCPKCGELVRAWQNIPLVSWVVLRGKCRYCKEPIPLRYPLVELLTGVLFAAVAVAGNATVSNLGSSMHTVAPGMVFMSILVAVTFIDLDHKIIPNAITYPGVPIGVAMSIGLGPEPRFASQSHWWIEVLVATVAAAAFLLIAAIIQPGGMGLGDVKLAAVMGAFLGAPVAVAMFAGFIFGLIPSIFLIIRHGKKARKMAIPFGPFLAGGAVVGWFFGAQILDAYLKTL